MDEIKSLSKSRLFQLKDWLTMPESAKYLSIMFGEKVEESDVLRLALDRRLKLSVNFVNKAHAKRGEKFQTFEEWEKDFRKTASWQTLETRGMDDGIISGHFPGNDIVFFLEDHDLINQDRPRRLGPDEELKNNLIKKKSAEDQSKFIIDAIEGVISFARKRSEEFGRKVSPDTTSFEGDVISIDGIWDLAMLGTERIDIEHRFQSLTGGPEVTLVGLDGAIVEDQDGILYQLQERFDEEYIKYHNSEEYKQTILDNYKKRLDERISNNEIDEDEAEELYEKRRQFLNKRNNDHEFFPAGGLPDDCVLVVRTQALLDLQERLSTVETKVDTNFDINSKTSLFNEKYEYHTKELKIAVEAWSVLYGKNPPAVTPKGGHRKYIDKWLEKNYPRLSDRAQERIITIVNPNQKGGASPIN